MKHHLSLLCFALISFLYVNETVANLLLKQNPTPLEPASYASSGESYQLAKVTWLPDYLGNNKSYGTNRVNDGGNDKNKRTCEAYGLLSSCPAHSVEKGIKHPIPGLTCYKECICDTSYYQYTIKTCRAPKVPSEECINSLFGQTTEAGVKKEMTTQGTATTQSRTTANLEQYIGSGAMSSASTLKRYAQCNCPAEYNKDSCPSNSVCEECDGKFKKTGCNSEYNRTFTEITMIKENASCLRCTHEGVTLYSCTCKSGYVLKKGSTLKEDTCVPDCADYTLTTCPPGGICDECTVNNTTKHRLKDCDGTKGWKYGSGTCEAVPCTTGYTAGVTTCASGSTKPDISLSDDWSGGQRCGLCKCNNVNSNCTAANYPVTSIPANATKTGECSTGCGSEKVTRYTFACNDGYELVDGECKEIITCGTGTVDTEKYWCAIPSTNCTSLGYTKNILNCIDKNIIKCPFDSSKISCF